VLDDGAVAAPPSPMAICSSSATFRAQVSFLASSSLQLREIVSERERARERESARAREGERERGRERKREGGRGRVREGESLLGTELHCGRSKAAESSKYQYFPTYGLCLSCCVAPRFFLELRPGRLFHSNFMFHFYYFLRCFLGDWFTSVSSSSSRIRSCSSSDSDISETS
jgi:hypothetical protein